MLQFLVPTLKDKQWLDPIFLNSGYIGADNAFGTIFVWKEAYNLKICKCDGFLLRIYDGKKIFYGFPLGNGNLVKIIYKLMADAEQRHTTLSFMGLTSSMVSTLNSVMPNAFNFESTRDAADYIYNVNDLIELKGKKYHSKRNHISKFNRNYNFVYENINVNNMDECKIILEKWYEENNYKNNTSLCKEKLALKLAIENFKELNFIGGLIKVDDKPIAMAIGEKINNEVFVVHFEKALKSYLGAYAIINNEFARNTLKTYKFINREEDLGIDGLRKAKLSYHPHIILEKYNAFLR